MIVMCFSCISSFCSHSVCMKCSYYLYFMNKIRYKKWRRRSMSKVPCQVCGESWQWGSRTNAFNAIFSALSRIKWQSHVMSMRTLHTANVNSFGNHQKKFFEWGRWNWILPFLFRAIVKELKQRTLSYI